MQILNDTSERDYFTQQESEFTISLKLKFQSRVDI